MNIECSVEKLKSAVVQSERVTGKNLTLPILSSILFIASGKSLKLRSTNLSLGIEIELPAKINKEGILAIPGGVMSNTLNSISGGDLVNLDGEDGNITLKTKKSSLKIKGQPTDDFPTIPIVEGVEFVIDSKKLVDGIKSVYYSSAVSDVKPEISSVFIYTDGENLVFVATDSFRLAEKKVRVKNIEEIKGILIPYKNVPEIIRVFGDINEEVKVCFNKNQISFSCDGVYLTSRVIDGAFPDYRQIMPQKTNTEVVVLKQDLLNALKLSNVFSDKFNQVNILVDPKNKTFELSSSNNDVGENKTQLDSKMSGDRVELGFNHKYFIDCFQSLGGDSVLIRFIDSTHPILISQVSDNSFVYLIMPMNR